MLMLLALLIILLAAAVMAGVAYYGGDPATVEVLDVSRDTTVAGVFFAGVGTMLLLTLGVRMMSAAMGRAARRRAERREMNDRHHDSVARLEEERTALRAENVRLSEQLAGHGDGSTERLVTQPGETGQRMRLSGNGYTTEREYRHRDPI